MGAMVSDRILTTLTQELTFKHIIYMGAANSIADFKVSVIPYLRGHDRTEFWSFALSEVNERNEKYHKYFDFLTRGSLLVWIDLLLERTYGLLQMRFGREVNQEWVNIDDKIAWNRICRISFSGNPARTKEPKKHGDFTEPDNVELVLRVVKNECPKPVKLPNKKPGTRSSDEFKEDLQEALEHVPRFAPKSVEAIANNAPYTNKDDLNEGEFLSDQTYKEIGNYFFPVNINTATTDELALILRGDRYLAQQIFEHTCKNPYRDINEVKRDIPHLSEYASDLIDHYGIFGESSPTKSLECPLQDRWSAIRHWWSNVHINPFYKSAERDKKISTANTRYLNKVISEIKKARINILPIEKARTWYMLPQKTPWDAIVDIQGQRVAIQMSTWAELEDKCWKIRIGIVPSNLLTTLLGKPANLMLMLSSSSPTKMSFPKSPWSRQKRPSRTRWGRNSTVCTDCPRPFLTRLNPFSIDTPRNAFLSRTDSKHCWSGNRKKPR